mgnify:CR=1 FL=1
MIERGLMQVGVTGSSGFLGSHLTNALNQLSVFDVTTLKRNSSGNFPEINELKSFVENLDLIYHVAGVNRGTNEEILKGNIQATFDDRGAEQNVRFAAHDDSIYSLMDQFLGLRFRHFPVEKDGEFIGLLSIGDVLKACLHEKTQEFEELHGMVSWEYYEEWKWNVAPEKREITRGIGRAS